MLTLSQISHFATFCRLYSTVSTSKKLCVSAPSTAKYRTDLGPLLEDFQDETQHEDDCHATSSRLLSLRLLDYQRSWRSLAVRWTAEMLYPKT